LFWSARDIVAGDNYDDDKFNRPGNALPAGSLAPGDHIRGNVLLLVPADTQVLRIKYATALIGGEDLYWLYLPGSLPGSATPGPAATSISTPGAF